MDERCNKLHLPFVCRRGNAASTTGLFETSIDQEERSRKQQSIARCSETLEQEYEAKS